MDTKTAVKHDSRTAPAFISIGADELILWMRKNGRAAEVRNDVLGGRLAELIEQHLGGRRVRENAPSLWDANDSAVGDLKLPKTACQYMIPANRINEIYAAIAAWRAPQNYQSFNAP